MLPSHGSGRGQRPPGPRGDAHNRMTTTPRPREPAVRDAALGILPAIVKNLEGLLSDLAGSADVLAAHVQPGNLAVEQAANDVRRNTPELRRVVSALQRFEEARAHP